MNKNISNELKVDVVGFWQLFASGKDSFDLDGQNLLDFLDRAITSLLESGIKPVRAINKNWVIQNQYGSQNNLIVSNLLKEVEKDVMPDGDGVWFSIYGN